MKKRINNLKVFLTAPFPAILCTIAGFIPNWIPWLLLICFLTIGLLIWFMWKSQRVGIVCIVIALLSGAVGIHNSNKEPLPTSIAAIGGDPMRSFFDFDQRAQKAWEDRDANLLEQMASLALYKSLEKGATFCSFAYYDNIWNKLEYAKRNGSPGACYNMAIMCLRGLGRPQSVDDAIELCNEAISQDSSFVSAYLLLEKIATDSKKHASTMAMVSKWRSEINRRDSIYNERFAELTGYFGVINVKDNDNIDSISDIITIKREYAFREVLTADTLSLYWKLTHDNIDVLRASSLSGNSSYLTLFLAAYYRGINNSDSALFFYDRYLASDIVTRMSTMPMSFFNNMITDTIVNIYSPNVTPLLLGLSIPDLDYLSNCLSDTFKVKKDLYFSNAALYAADLKYNRFFNGSNPFTYTSDIYGATKKFLTNINEIISLKSPVIDYPKSKRYKYNTYIDIFRGTVKNCRLPQNKYTYCRLLIDYPQKKDSTLLYYDGGIELRKETDYLKTRSKLGESYARLQHYINNQKEQ